MRKVSPGEIVFRDFFLRLIRQMEEQEKFSTATNYRKTMESFLTFMGRDDFTISSIGRETIQSYVKYLNDRHVTRNTISFYNRILRAGINKARKEGLCSVTPELFSDVYTGADTTRKRALDLRTIRTIARLDLSNNSELALVRDLFIFSFYARGMCFVDMAYLKTGHICGGYICYIRNKTGQPLKVKLEPCMFDIIQRWQPYSYESYVFPILESTLAAEAFRQYTYKLSRYNLLLKTIGKLAGTDFPLNSYAARHTWATIALNLSIPLTVISSGMGHTSEKTTRIYLDSLDNSIIDKANETIIEKVS